MQKDDRHGCATACDNQSSSRELTGAGRLEGLVVLVVRHFCSLLAMCVLEGLRSVEVLGDRWSSAHLVMGFGWEGLKRVDFRRG